MAFGPGYFDSTWPFGTAHIVESLPQISITAKLDGFLVALLTEQLVGDPGSIRTVRGDMHSM